MYIYTPIVIPLSIYTFCNAYTPISITCTYVYTPITITCTYTYPLVLHVHVHTYYYSSILNIFPGGNFATCM